MAIRLPNPAWLPGRSLSLLLLTWPAAVEAQFIFGTNADGTLSILQYTGTETSVVIPASTNGRSVTAIGDGAFSNLAITGVTIPNSVISIGFQAFSSCLLTNATVGNGVGSGFTTVGTNAFYGCIDLTSVTLGTNVINIGAQAFYGCSSLANVTIPGSVTNLGNYAFADCFSLTNATIGNRVGSIPAYAFAQCWSLATVTIGNSVTSIGTWAFYRCTNLNSASIPNTVTNVGVQAFYSCTSLESLKIGRRLATIGDEAFSWCGRASLSSPSKLAGIYFQGNAPDLGSYPNMTFYGDSATVYYLPGTTGWGSSLGSLPTVLWNPSIQSSKASFGVRTNRFGFDITGTADIPIVVEACTDPANSVWLPLQTSTLTNGSIYFSDPDWTNYPARFYRIRPP